jgi:hypothetical protein
MNFSDCLGHSKLTVVPTFTAITSSLAFSGRSPSNFRRAVLIPRLVSGVVGAFIVLKMLCAGLVSLKVRSMATASVLVPPGIKRYCKFLIKELLVIHTNVYPNYDLHLNLRREDQRDNEVVDLSYPIGSVPRV